jgi:hypothetical protein
MSDDLTKELEDSIPKRFILKAMQQQVNSAFNHILAVSDEASVNHMLKTMMGTTAEELRERVGEFRWEDLMMVGCRIVATAIAGAYPLDKWPPMAGANGEMINALLEAQISMTRQLAGEVQGNG